MKTRNILIFPAGTEIGLEINEAIRQCKEVNVFGGGIGAIGNTPFAYANFYPLPAINESGWLDELSSLCIKLEIDYIFPAHDDVVVALAREQHHIPAVVLTASLETCVITRSKRLTYHALSQIVRVPKLFDSPPLSSDYPVFVKPDCSQGSQGASLVCMVDELNYATASIIDPLVCEYLPGEEYTVDCFSDRDQGVLFSGARIRQRVRNGISVSSVPIDLEGVNVIANKIHDALQMRGAWFFQVKRASDGELALLEVAPRIAGSMSAHRVAGVNFPLLSIFEHERASIRMLINTDQIELDRSLRNRFKHRIKFSTLYIDLDDTIIFREQVNVDAVNLIFQCVNQGVKIKLLTRHNGDLHKILDKHRLSGLFDEVIHIGSKGYKSEYIAEKDAIFVDDSFSERWEVHHKTGIRTFDCSMIELLIQAQPIILKEVNAK